MIFLSIWIFISLNNKIKKYGKYIYAGLTPKTVGGGVFLCAKQEAKNYIDNVNNK